MDGAQSCSRRGSHRFPPRQADWPYLPPDVRPDECRTTTIRAGRQRYADVNAGTEVDVRVSSRAEAVMSNVAALSTTLTRRRFAIGVGTLGAAVIGGANPASAVGFAGPAASFIGETL